MRRSPWQIAGACLNTAALCCLVATLVFAVRDFAAEQVRQKEVVAMEILREANRRTYYQRFPGKYLVDPNGNAWFVPPPLPPWEKTSTITAFVPNRRRLLPPPQPSPKPLPSYGAVDLQARS